MTPTPAPAVEQPPLILSCGCVWLGDYREQACTAHNRHRP